MSHCKKSTWDERSLLWSVREIQSATSKQWDKVELLINMEGLGDDQIFLGKGFKILFWIKLKVPIRHLIGDTNEQLVK